MQKFALVCVLTFFICGDALSTRAASVKNNLQAFLDGKLPAQELIITYSDMHGLWGRLEITIVGTGKVEQISLRTKAGKAHNLTREEVHTLVALLIDLEAWEQKTPQRTPLPDESQAYLRIRAGSVSSEIWEWYNEMEANNRLSQILEMIEKLAWEHN